MKSFSLLLIEVILMTVTLVLMARAETSGDQQGQGLATTCFQGSLKTDKNYKINIANSWKEVVRKPCKPQTTTSASMTTIMMTTTETAAIETTDATTEIAEVASTAAISTESMPLTTSLSTAAPVNATEAVTLQDGDATTINGTGKGRRKRDADNLPLITEGNDNYYCQIFYYSNSDSTKVNYGKTSTLEFSCTEDKPSVECNTGAGTNATMDGHNGTLYCCDSDNCNTPFLVINDDNLKVGVATVSTCDHYTSQGIQPVPCLEESHMCLNYTTNKGTTYMCGNEVLEGKFCLEDGWFRQGCSREVENVTACCYLEEVEPSFTTSRTSGTTVTTVTPMADDGKKGSQVTTMVIMVLVTFVIGIICGCLLLVLLQKKCRKRPVFDDMMDFSYSRFKSAESGADEL